MPYSAAIAVSRSGLGGTRLGQSFTGAARLSAVLLSHSASVPLPYIAYFTFDDQLPTLEEALSGRTSFMVM